MKWKKIFFFSSYCYFSNEKGSSTYFEIENTDNLWLEIAHVCKSLNRKILMDHTVDKIAFHGLVCIESHKLEEFISLIAEKNNCAAIFHDDGTIIISKNAIFCKSYKIPILPSSIQEYNIHAENLIFNLQKLVHSDLGESFVVDSEHNIVVLRGFPETHAAVQQYLNVRNHTMGKKIKLKFTAVESSLDFNKDGNLKSVIVGISKMFSGKGMRNKLSEENLLALLQDLEKEDYLQVMLEIESTIIDNQLFSINTINDKTSTTKDIRKETGGYDLQILPTIKNDEVIIMISIKMKNFQFNDAMHQVGDCHIQMYTSLKNHDTLLFSGIKTQIKKSSTRVMIPILQWAFSSQETRSSNLYFTISVVIEENSMVDP